MGQFKELDIEIQDLLAQDETPASISYKDLVGTTL